MNKKRKKKLIISCLLLILLIGFNGVMLVNGDDSNCVDGICENGDGSLGGNLPTCKEGGWCYSGLGVGVRISIVDGSGKKMAGPYDIIGKIRDDECQYGTYYTVGSGKKIKQEVSPAVPTAAGTNVASLANKQVTSSESTWYLSNEVSINDIIGPNNTAIHAESYRMGIYNYLVKLKNDDKSKLASSLNELFDTLGYKHVENITASEAENLFLQFEPIIIAREKEYGCSKYYRAYYGTVTEIANISLSSEAKDKKSDYLFRNNSIWYYGTGMDIAKSGYPSLSVVATSSNRWKVIADNKTSGYGVAHIWLKDFLEADGDCFQLLKIVNNNPSIYGAPGTDTYEAAVQAIRTGNTDYKFKDADGKIYKSNGEKYTDPKEHYWLEKDHYMLREKMGKKASCYAPQVNCETAIKYINEWSGLTIPSGDYDTAVSQVADGEYIYYASSVYNTKDEDGNTVTKEDYVIMDKAYLEKEYLKKDKYGDGKASCNGTGLSCDDALKEIHSNSEKYGTAGSAKYNDNIALVREGKFSYEATEKDASGKDITVVHKMDRAYPEHTNLLPKNYGNGEASCDSTTTISCGTSALIKIDPCDSPSSGYNYYKDSSNSKYWLECGTAFIKGGIEYSSDNTGHVAVETTNGGIVGNSEYCKLYCYEEFETNFPGKVENVKAGQTFGWGQIGFGTNNTYGTIRIHKQCSNKDRTDTEGLTGDGYLYKKWENKYKTNERDLIDGYIQKGAAEDARAKLDEQHLYGATRTCCQTETYSCKVGKRWTTCTRCKIWGYVGWARSGQSHNNQNNAFGSSANWTGASTQSANGTGSSSCVLSYSAAESTARRQAYNQLTSQINAGQSKSSTAKTEEPKLLEKIRQCTNNIKYVYKTVVTFSFEEPENHQYGPNDRMFSNHDELDVTPVNGTEGYNTNNVNKSTCTTKKVPTYTCSGNRLSANCVVATIEDVLDCKKVTWDINGEWEYSYKAGEFEWYSLKTNNKLMNGTNKTGEGDEFFYSLGYGLPTAFTLPSGVYGDTDDTEMAVIVTNLGDHGEISDDTSVNKEKNYNAAEGHFAPVAESINGGKGFKYQCTYEVDNDMFGYDCEYQNGSLTSNSPLYCDKSKDNNPNGELVGIDVAYRLVSLLNAGDDINKAFPGQAGTGRRIGLNWSKVSSEIPDILRADVYQQDRNGQPNLAMYEIFLDVKKIHEIRQDSKNFAGSGDPYTSFENIKCAGDNKKYCASDFISQLASGSKNDPTVLQGTCITDLDTQTRANNVLANGCNGTYTFPTINWVR